MRRVCSVPMRPSPVNIQEMPQYRGACPAPTSQWHVRPLFGMLVFGEECQCRCCCLGPNNRGPRTAFPIEIQIQDSTRGQPYSKGGSPEIKGNVGIPLQCVSNSSSMSTLCPDRELPPLGVLPSHVCEQRQQIL